MFARSAKTRAEAWLLAAQAMKEVHARMYNVVLEIECPGLATNASRAIEKEIDAFLNRFGAQPNHTVAETIFPAAEYRQGGIEAVYRYPQTIYPYIRSAPQNYWGTYALRLMERKCADGSTICPLELAITKLKKQIAMNAPKRAVYELDLGLEPLELKLYSAEDDHKRNRAGQCLSHISLKLGPKHELYMTAIYRYQYYVQKAAGNLLGLARLQAAIAREVGIPAGPLVCHATMAILEDRSLDKEAPWSRNDVIGLLERCQALLDQPVDAAA